MKELGETLRKRREEKKLSLEEVSSEIKINHKILRAIENADLENLPTKTFLRGFIRSYGLFLGFSENEVTDFYVRALEESKFSKASPALKPQSEVRTQSSGVEHIGKVVVVVVIIFGVIFIRQQVQKYESERVIPIVDLPEILGKDLLQESKSSETEDLEDIEATPKKNIDTVPKPVSIEIAEPIEDPVREIVEEVIEEAPEARWFRLRFEAFDDVLLDIYRGERLLERLEISAMEKAEVVHQGPLRVELSDGGAVNLFVNGRERGVLGDLGRPFILNLE